MGKAAGVSRRRKKVARIKVKSKSALKKQRLKQLRRAKPLDPDIKANWDEKKTMGENMLNMGLAPNANKLLPVTKSFENMGLPDPEQMPEEMDLDEQIAQLGKKKKAKKSQPEKKFVAEALEKEASQPTEKRFKFGPELSKLIVYMMEKHGSDFESMARDKKNVYQYSTGHIRKLIKKFLSIPANRRAYERAVADL